MDRFRNACKRIAVRWPPLVASPLVAVILSANVGAGWSASKEVAPRARASASESVTTSCRWLEGFGVPGPNGTVYSVVAWNDGTGEHLFVAGNFVATEAGPASNVARWDGSEWRPLGAGLDGEVRALAVYDDGAGDALFAGGDFSSPDGIGSGRVAKWTGSSWESVGLGVDGPVFAMATWNDGDGNRLVVGGSFGQAGQETVSSLAAWDGTDWSGVGGGLAGDVHALQVWDDGAGDGLFVGGAFYINSLSGGNIIAKWDGANWSALDGGLYGSFVPTVFTMGVWNDGANESLIVGGRFENAYGPPTGTEWVTLGNVGRWDGTAWHALGSGTASIVRSTLSLPGGELLVGSEFGDFGGQQTNGLASWNGAVWSTVSSGFVGKAFALGSLPGARGSSVFVAGERITTPGNPEVSLIELDGVEWQPMAGAPARGLDGQVLAFQQWSSGGGERLYVGGSFKQAGSLTVNGIAAYGPNGWTALGTGVDETVLWLHPFHDGESEKLFVAGGFGQAGGMAASGIAAWNGTSWETVSGGLEWNGSPGGSAEALETWDDGGGEALFVGGGFTSIGGVEARHIARWDGLTWSALGAGFTGGFAGGRVYALLAWDDGRGLALYAAGSFAASGETEVLNIARWDGTSWEALGSGLNGGAVALEVWDDGTGEALYVGGGFTEAGGVPANRIAKWDGTSWSAVGLGLDASVSSLEPWRIGNEEVLAVGGWFSTANGVDSPFLAFWDGSTWQSAAGQPDDVVSILGHWSESLYAGGLFSSVSNVNAGSIGRYSCSLIFESGFETGGISAWE